MLCCSLQSVGHSLLLLTAVSTQTAARRRASTNGHYTIPAEDWYVPGPADFLSCKRRSRVEVDGLAHRKKLQENIPTAADQSEKAYKAADEGKAYCVSIRDDSCVIAFPGTCKSSDWQVDASFESVLWTDDLKELKVNISLSCLQILASP